MTTTHDPDGFYPFTRYALATGEIVNDAGRASQLHLVQLQADDEHGVIDGHWSRDHYRVEPGDPPRVVAK